MSSIIVCVGLAGFSVRDSGNVPIGQYLQHFDPDAHDGRGEAVWTSDLQRAKRFANMSQAMSFWRRQSTVCPLRPDGQPNRPLTAFSVEVVPL